MTADILSKRPSTLRKFQERVTDPKYEGKRISRSQLEREDSPSESEDSESDAVVKIRGVEDDANASPQETDSESSHGHVRFQVDIDEAEKTDDEADDAKAIATEEGMSAMLKRTREQERLKGKAVIRQTVSAIYSPLSSSFHLRRPVNIRQPS